MRGASDVAAGRSGLGASALRRDGCESCHRRRRHAAVPQEKGGGESANAHRKAEPEPENTSLRRRHPPPSTTCLAVASAAPGSNAVPRRYERGPAPDRRVRHGRRGEIMPSRRAGPFGWSAAAPPRQVEIENRRSAAASGSARRGGRGARLGGGLPPRASTTTPGQRMRLRGRRDGLTTSWAPTASRAGLPHDDRNRLTDQQARVAGGPAADAGEIARELDAEYGAGDGQAHPPGRWRMWACGCWPRRSK